MNTTQQDPPTWKQSKQALDECIQCYKERIEFQQRRADTAERWLRMAVRVLRDVAAHSIEPTTKQYCLQAVQEIEQQPSELKGNYILDSLAGVMYY